MEILRSLEVKLLFVSLIVIVLISAFGCGPKLIQVETPPPTPEVYEATREAKVVIWFLGRVAKTYTAKVVFHCVGTEAPFIGNFTATPWDAEAEGIPSYCYVAYFDFPDGPAITIAREKNEALLKALGIESYPLRGPFAPSHLVGEDAWDFDDYEIRLAHSALSEGLIKVNLYVDLYELPAAFPDEYQFSAKKEIGGGYSLECVSPAGSVLVVKLRELDPDKGIGVANGAEPVASFDLECRDLATQKLFGQILTAVLDEGSYTVEGYSCCTERVQMPYDAGVFGKILRGDVYRVQNSEGGS